MPNHVHVVTQLHPAWTLEKVLHSWKSFTARQANRLLGRSGAFWAREYHDRSILDEDTYVRMVRYTLENPENAGLRDWSLVWGDGEG